MPDKTYRVIVSVRAAQMMVSHAAFLARINSDAAEDLTEEFRKTAASLDQMPYRGPWLEGKFIPFHKYRRLVFAKWYLLIYQVVDDTVYIDYVVDGRQDYKWLFY